MPLLPPSPLLPIPVLLLPPSPHPETLVSPEQGPSDSHSPCATPPSAAAELILQVAAPAILLKSRFLLCQGWAPAEYVLPSLRPSPELFSHRVVMSYVAASVSEVASKLSRELSCNRGLLENDHDIGSAPLCTYLGFHWCWCFQHRWQQVINHTGNRGHWQHPLRWPWPIVGGQRMKAQALGPAVAE